MNGQFEVAATCGPSPVEGLFSVVIIFLDAERFIAETIESVLSQTYAQWELILVDDGSTDGSTRIARRYAERFPDRIRYLEHPGHVNHGMSAARNLGARYARGEYLAFLDADDVFLPERLHRHACLLRAHPDVDCVQSCCVYWSSWMAGEAHRDADQIERPPMGEAPTIVDPPFLLLLLLETHGGTASSPCNMSIRRRAFEAVGGCEDAFRNQFEDQVLWSKLYLNSRVVAVPDVLALYRRHAASFTARAGEAAVDAARHGYLDWLAHYVRQRGLARPVLDRAIDSALFEYLHPRLHLIRQLPTLAMRGLRRIGFALLPRPVANRVAGHWRAHKERNAIEYLGKARFRVISVAGSRTEGGE